MNLIRCIKQLLDLTYTWTSLKYEYSYGLAKFRLDQGLLQKIRLSTRDLHRKTLFTSNSAPTLT